MCGDQLGDGVLERLDALAGDRGDGIKGQLAALGEGGELFELGGVGDVDLGGDQDGWAWRRARGRRIRARR